MFIIRLRNRNNSIHHTKGFRRPVIAALLLAMTGSGHVLGIELQTEVEQHEGRYLPQCQNQPVGATGVCIKTTVIPPASGYFDIYSGSRFLMSVNANEFSSLPAGQYQAWVPQVPHYAASFAVRLGQVTEVRMGTLQLQAITNAELQIGHDTETDHGCEQGVFIDIGSNRFAIPLAPGDYVLDFGGSANDPQGCGANEFEVRVDEGMVTQVRQRH